MKTVSIKAERMSAGVAFAILLLTSAVACSRGDATTTPIIDNSGAPSIAELANATYAGIVEEPVTLIEGRWEGTPYVAGGAARPAVGLVEHGALTGDLDDDGSEEAAVLLWESSGGSGTRLYLAVMDRRDGDVENIGTTLVGDRIQVRGGSIDGKRIVLSIVRAGPKDAACCPTEKAVMSWELDENALYPVENRPTGTLSLADLEGPEWVLRELGRGTPPPDGVTVTLVVRDGRVSGNSGCNTYFAGVSGPTPGELHFNGMGATRAACAEPTMEFERQYLKILATAAGYDFLAGHLVLTCQTGNEPVALRFAPQGTDALH
jgi:heat shock protein HslJ